MRGLQEAYLLSNGFNNLYVFRRHLGNTEQLLTRLNGTKDVIQLVEPLCNWKYTLKGAPGISFDIPFEFYALELASRDAAP